MPLQRTRGLWPRPLRRHRIDTLILACTHFPLLRKAIRRVLGEGVALVDCAATCAHFARERLAALHLLNPQRRRHGRLQAYVTDEPERFTLVANRFLGVRIEPALQVELAAVGKRNVGS